MQFSFDVFNDPNSEFSTKNLRSRNQKQKYESMDRKARKELEEKLAKAEKELETVKKERDDLEIKLNDAFLERESLAKQLARSDATDPLVSWLGADFNELEIEKATDGYKASSIIGVDDFWYTYKGVLRHTEVAIKVLNWNCLHGLKALVQEVDILSKLRHPNIVTLIGVCDEVALIYEYLPNGSLEDRLSCKDNTTPLSWQTRTRIAAELCSVLMFLHSCQPKSIIHGDLKPSSVLLDARLSCKLSGFRICGVINSPMENATRDPKCAFAYMDPESLTTGEFTPKSDIYSLGIILLRLLTGKSALGIAKEVQAALHADKLDTVLDPSAGDWPFVQAKQLALLGLRCCEMQVGNRADLKSDVWRVLKPMMVSSGNLYNHAPSHFTCPILQEVMQDPHIAADGFTYEKESLKGWLDSGHNTSPMTNLKLSNRTLIPNRSLRSAIQEWQQQQQQRST